jgi:hypothetical protein
MSLKINASKLNVSTRQFLRKGHYRVYSSGRRVWVDSHRFNKKTNGVN